MTNVSKSGANLSEAEENIETKRREIWGASYADIVAITAAWGFKIIRPWLWSWHEFTYNLNLQRVSSFLFVILVIKCFTAICLALITDLRHSKYKVYMHFLFFYAVFPLYGIVEALVPSFTLRMMMDWIHVLSDIIHPIELGAIFHQASNLSRLHSYIWSSVLCGVTNTTSFFIPWLLPYHCPLLSADIIFVWVLMGLMYLQFQLFTIFALKYVKPETFKETHIRIAIAGMTSDLKSNNDPVLWGIGRKTVRYVLLIALVVPVAYQYLVKETLKLIEIPRDVNVRHFGFSNNMFHFGKMIGTPVIACVLLVVRRYRPKLADVLTLGLPHLVNLVAVTIIFVRLLTYDSGEYIGPIPDESSMVLRFINADYNNRSVCIDSKDFEPLRLRAMENLARVVKTKGDTIAFTILLDPHFDSIVPYNHYVKFKKDSLKIFIIQLGTVSMDRDITVQAVRVTSVWDIGHVRPGYLPKVIWLTSIEEFADGVLPEIHVHQGKNDVVHELPRIDRAIIEELDDVQADINLVWRGENTGSMNTVLAQRSFKPQLYTVYVVMIHEHNGLAKLSAKRQRQRPSTNEIWPSKATIHIFGLMKTRKTSGNELPEKRIIREDPVFAFSFFIHGMAYATSYSGHIHLFWMDAPSRLRTTLMSAFSCLLWNLRLFPRLSNVDYHPKYGLITFEFDTILVVYIIMIIATAFHFLAAYYFYYKLGDAPVKITPSANSGDAFDSPSKDAKDAAAQGT